MTHPAPGLTARALRRAIRAYQHLTVNRPPTCRFTPSCSEYAYEALALHGAVRGSWLAARRIGRCQPFGGHGPDPVPDPRLDVHRHRAGEGVQGV
jgi:uncharacterized protein